MIDGKPYVRSKNPYWLSEPRPPSISMWKRVRSSWGPSRT